MVLDILTAADRVNLLELYARSSMLLDLGRCQEWTDLFEAGAVVRCSAGRQFRGHDELLKLARDTVEGRCSLALVPMSSPVRCRHVLSNVSPFAEGNRKALGYAYLSVGRKGDLTARQVAAGVYFDQLWRSASGCWRFSSRLFTSDETTGTLREPGRVDALR